ncbi:MAG: diacylglycerol/lipid kinase family protein [Oscillospiraceae bacterium]
MPALPERRLLLLVNPVAGKRQGEKHLAAIVRGLMEHGWQATVLVTGCAGEAAELAEHYGGAFERVVCVGGDGTLNETATGLLRAGLSVPLGYLPAGSTNDLAEFLRLPAELPEAVEKAALGEPRPVDVGCFNERYFLNIAEFGAFSWLPYTTPQYLKNVFGYYAYILDGVKDLGKLRSDRLRLTAGERVLEGDFIFGAVCSATNMGGVFDLPEGAVQPDDGSFEVLLIRSPTSALALQEVITALRSRDYADPHIEFFRASSLTVETDTPFDWAVDGERASPGRWLRIENLPRRLPLIY